MNRKSKREALQILMGWPSSLIKSSLENPTPYMGHTMLALHKIALRRKGDL